MISYGITWYIVTSVSDITIRRRRLWCSDENVIASNQSSMGSNPLIGHMWVSSHVPSLSSDP